MSENNEALIPASAEKVLPRIIKMPSIGASDIGFITVAEGNSNIPFDIKRVYWTYYTPQNISRGYHAHKALHQVIFAVNGKIKFHVEDLHGGKYEFILDEPHLGLYLPPMTWREIVFSHSAVLMCLASEVYMESDYIRSYEDFIHEARKG